MSRTPSENSQEKTRFSQEVSQEPCEIAQMSLGDALKHAEEIFKEITHQFECEDAISREAVIEILNNATLGESKIAERVKELPSVQPSRKVIEDIKAEIDEYKDDKVIHAERNEMIDIVLQIIDKHISGKEGKDI